MKIENGFITFLVVMLLAGCAITQVTQSPLGGVAVGAAGIRDVKIYTRPHCCPSTALEIRSKEKLSDTSTQWVNFGFSIPNEPNMQALSGVEVCYEIKTTEPGRSYISQTRLTNMSLPNTASVRVDDPTDRTDLGPQCYTTEGGFEPDGVVTLALRVVIGDVADSIIIGSTRLLF